VSLQLRTPETYYFTHGQIKFKKIKGGIVWFKSVWDVDGKTLSTIESGLIENETHLKNLLAIQDLGSVM